jgi:hypothetical protein
VEAKIGHIIVHFLYTGVYQTLSSGSESWSLQLRRALRVYIAADTYALPGLQQLAKREIIRNAENLDIPGVFEAVRADFEKLSAKGWFHEYLQERIAATFEEDFTVFKSENILNSLDSTALHKFAIENVLALSHSKILQMERTEENLRQTLEETTKMLSAGSGSCCCVAGRQEFCNDDFRTEESVCSHSSPETFSSSADELGWSGETFIDAIDYHTSRDVRAQSSLPMEDRWEEIPKED